jgi:hypothetical protein
MSLTKKNFVLRINEEAYNALAKWAEDEFRSVNGQIEMILDKALKESNRLKITTVKKSKSLKTNSAAGGEAQGNTKVQGTRYDEGSHLKM